MIYKNYKYVLVQFRPNDNGIYNMPSDGIPVGSEKITFDEGKTWERVVFCLIPDEARICANCGGYRD